MVFPVGESCKALSLDTSSIAILDASPTRNGATTVRVASLAAAAAARRHPFRPNMDNAASGVGGKHETPKFLSNATSNRPTTRSKQALQASTADSTSPEAYKASPYSKRACDSATRSPVELARRTARSYKQSVAMFDFA